MTSLYWIRALSAYILHLLGGHFHITKSRTCGEKIGMGLYWTLDMATGKGNNGVWLNAGHYSSRNQERHLSYSAGNFQGNRPYQYIWYRKDTWAFCDKNKSRTEFQRNEQIECINGLFWGFFCWKGCFNIKMPSYQYRNSIIKIK